MSVLELLISFPFASVFLLQAHLICWRRRRWGRSRREQKEKKFAKNKVCAGERWESAVKGTAGSQGVTAGASDPNASAGSSSRHTNTQPDPSLFPARVSQPGALARRSPRLRRAALSKQRAAPFGFAWPRGGGGCPELGRVRGSGRVPAPPTVSAQTRSLLRTLPRR